MLIETLCNMIYSVITTALNSINIPSLDSNTIAAFDFLCDTISDYSSNFISLVIPSQLCRRIFDIFIVILAIDLLYPMIMWVLRKIPFVSIN